METNTFAIKIEEYLEWLENESGLPEDIQDIIETLARTHRHFDGDTDTLNLTKEDVISSMVVESIAFLGAQE